MAEKFASQQEALRCALAQAGITNAIKGQLVITDEQRTQVADTMMGWLKEERWSIKPGTRAFSDPRNYIAGRQPTCLIQAWCAQKPRTNTTAAASPTTDKMAALKQAVDMGLITKEQAQAEALKILGIG